MHAGKPPDDYTHEHIKRTAEINELLAQSGWSKAEMAERFSETGIKLPTPFARLIYFNLVLDWLYDPMHEIMNVGNRLASTLLGMDFEEKVRSFAKEEGAHPERYRTEWVKKTDGEFSACSMYAVVCDTYSTC